MYFLISSFFLFLFSYEADDSDDDKRRPMPPFLDKLQKIQRFFTKDEDGKRLAKIGGEIKLLILRLRKRARNALRAYLKRLIDEE